MRIMHMTCDIRGLLNNFKRKSLADIVTDTETGRSLTDSEARAHLNGFLESGWRVLPMSDCPTFDHQTGCNCCKLSDTEWLTYMQSRGEE
jgi:hypothetical protein